MQERGNKIQWLPWLLMGMLWLLGGCVAPDGSVMRFKQADDGKIVGWQLDVPTVTADAAETAVYPPKPILYLGFSMSRDRGMDAAIKGVDVDGTPLGTVGHGTLVGWSPQGDRFAYLKPVGETFDEFFNLEFSLVVAKLEGEEQTIFETRPEEKLLSYVRQSAWSPDGTQIALVLKKGNSLQVVLVQVANGQIATEIPLKIDDILVESLMDFRVQVQWAPDGQKLLLQSATTVVLNLKTGETEVVIDMSAMGDIPFPVTDHAEWLPRGDGVIYLDYDYNGRSGASLPRLWRKQLGEEPVLLLSSEQLAELGIDSRLILSINLSPLGTYLALVGTELVDDEDSSLVALITRFNVTTLVGKSPVAEAGVLPVEQLEVAGTVASVEWSPDEQALAFQMLSEKGLTIEVLEWSEGTSFMVADVISEKIFFSEATSAGLTLAEAQDILQNLPTGSGWLLFTGPVMGINLVSWMP